MVKFIYPIWKVADQRGDDFRETLIHALVPQLLEMDAVAGVRVAVVDSAVSPAAAKRMENCQPLPTGVISVYLMGSGQETGDEKARVDAAIATHAARTNCYQVRETEVLRHMASSGERTYGFCQLVFLARPARLTEVQWLELWQGCHTQIAIDTQSTFGYRQNVIEESFSDGAPVLHAMIEENFPPEAMTSDRAFYGVDNDKDLQKNLATMLESCARFIDFDKIDVIPMSEYSFGV